MFKIDDAVLVDIGDFELASPGASSKLPGVVLAINEGLHLGYHVRVRLQLGATLDLCVPAEKVSNADLDPAPVPRSLRLSCAYNA